MTLDQFTDGLLYAGMLGIVCFTVLYAVRSKWWRYLEGVALLGRSLSLALVSCYVGVVVFLGDFLGRDVVRVLVYLFFVVASWFSVFVLLRRQAQWRHERDALLEDERNARETEESVSTLD